MKVTEETKPNKTGRNWTKCFEDAEKASASLPDVFRGIATISRTVLYKIDDEIRRLNKYFKAEWNTPDPKLGKFHKPWVAFKYAVLLTAGALSCVPGFSAAVGFAGGIITGIISANRNSVGLLKTVAAAIYGGWVGLQLGWIPVIGPGMACGIVKGTVEGIQDAWNTPEVSGKSWWNKFREFNNPLNSVAIIGKRIGLGALKGFIPVIGFALVEAKLGRTSEKTMRLKGGNMTPPAPATAATTKEITPKLIMDAKKIAPGGATATATQTIQQPKDHSTIRK